jgi:hypothetical protein
MYRYLQYLHRCFKLRNSRYQNLFRTIRAHQCQQIVEVGVYNGRTARKMIQTASISHRPAEIFYHGFDLFEQLTDGELESELSKRPPTRSVVQSLLHRTGANINLYQGNTLNTLSKFADAGALDDSLNTLIFIDGGHSAETVDHDWENLQPCLTRKTVVIFDDYYPNAHPAIEGKGCQKLVHSLDPARYRTKILEPVNQFQKDWGELQIQMVQLQLV